MKPISQVWDSLINNLNPVYHLRRFWNRHGQGSKVLTFHEMLCFIIVFIALFYSFFGEFLISFAPDATTIAPEKIVAPFESYNHILGTDIYGRDLLDVFLLGIHKNYLVAIVMLLIVGVLIVPLALVLGFYLNKDFLIRSLTAPLTVFVSLFYYFVLSALFGPTLFIAALAVFLHIVIYAFYGVYRDVVRVMDSNMVKYLLLDGASFGQVLRLVLLPTLIGKISRLLRRILILIVTELILIGVLQLGVSPTSVYWGNVMFQAWKHQDLTPYALIILTGLVSLVLYASFVIFGVVEDLVRSRIELARQGASNRYGFTRN
ncbi:hypothetical protein CJP74_07150 [Psittacicella melopsittaci]|uniref:ABC transmembrane type-1 domain-containing protein n=1 Tax=Psittacicella melopsittaci TaxID=2028576 RepID=A0A3A1Y265_9GAMM|nr:ABC transporter permease subunit [Psittacicella melopsittaci]RIY31531.1 hypothetical protein CJP74_07150 [Psittacicella melopsittaci]